MINWTTVIGLEYYADQVRKDSPHLYYYYRFYEQHFLLPEFLDKEELLRKAAIKIYTEDRFACGTVFPYNLSDLEESEIQTIASAVDIDGDEDANHLLRGRLWVDASLHRNDPETFLRHALAELDEVKPEHRDTEYLDNLAKCFDRLDYGRYRTVIPELLRSVEPEKRAFHLIDALRSVAQRRDWETYQLWRVWWDDLPLNAYMCDCYINDLYVSDATMALDAGEIDRIPVLLEKSVDVRGCPHLNSGGPRLTIIEDLIDRQMLPEICKLYLDKCAQFTQGGRAEELRSRLA